MSRIAKQILLVELADSLSHLELQLYGQLNRHIFLRTRQLVQIIQTHEKHNHHGENDGETTGKTWNRNIRTHMRARIDTKMEISDENKKNICIAMNGWMCCLVPCRDSTCSDEVATKDDTSPNPHPQTLTNIERHDSPYLLSKKQTSKTETTMNRDLQKKILFQGMFFKSINNMF